MDGHSRRGSLTTVGASCPVRTGSRSYCRECEGLGVHRERPRQQYPTRSSVRNAMFVVP